MAQKTVKLYVRKWGYVDSGTPVGVTDLSGLTEIEMNRWYGTGPNWDGSELFFTVDAFPSSLRKNRIYYAKATFAFFKGIQKSSYTMMYSEESFNPATLEYSNKPILKGPNFLNSATIHGSPYEYEDFELVPDTATAENLSKYTSTMLRAPTHVLLQNEPPYSGYQNTSGKVKLHTLTNNSALPYIEVTYDDAVIVNGKVTMTQYPSGSGINPSAAQTFAWDYVHDGTYSCVGETWKQKSAVLYWKKSTESSYHEVEVSGDTKYATIPANTFQTGSTIQWYVKGTDENNNVTQTDVYSFTTLTTTITPDSFPSGTSVDNRTEKRFTWHFASSGGNFGQSSAELYWRVQDAETWNSIQASGSTQSIAVQGYTFPADKTIEWYLRGVDATGTASTSATKTFKTLAYTLTTTSAPSGQNVEPRDVSTFSWRLANTQGAAAQKSAVLYWRVQGGASYNEIPGSEDVQSLSVPGYTFPTSSTIQWYLRVTAEDDTVKETNPATFTTVSPQVTPTIYPSGSNVYSGTDITFKWQLATSVGNYDQKSAVFYWRLSSAEEYRSISISGNTQQVTIPALTFPTNATVYWYITAIDSGDHSSSTSVQNFNTSATKITPQSSPTSGYTNPRNEITFSWYFAASGGSIPQGSASLFWRVQGESAYNEVEASGSTTSVTIPANTFPVASEIEWYISGSDSSGTSSQSSVYSFSTTAAQVHAVVKSPVNSGVDGSKEITFQWTLTTADGFAASRVILQWKLPTEDEQHWHTIIDTTDAITQYTVESGTFQSGEINWRVQAYNVDSIAGPESSASFVCIIAPTITALTASNVPFSVIRWQANDQQGFQLEIDGVNFGPYSGTEKEFAVPDYFRDGVHTIRLRIVGTVDLWSDWEETTVSIENTQGVAISLQENADINVTLEWQAGDTETDFYIYRDGKLIGRTENTRFVDRLSIGTHEYTVINRLSDGNYSRSETVEATTTVEYIYLATADGLTEVNLRYRLKGSEEPKHTYAKESHLNRIAGRDYPTLTRSRFRDHTISCEAVILSREAELYERFERLAAEPVVAKIRDGTCCAAVIESYGETAKKTYYRAYEFTLHEIDWEDFDGSQ